MSASETASSPSIVLATAAKSYRSAAYGAASLSKLISFGTGIAHSQSVHIRLFQSLLRKHFFLQPCVEANLFEDQGRLRAFGGCAHLHAPRDPDAGDFFEIACFQDSLLLALLVIHLGKHCVRHVLWYPDIDVCILRLVGRDGTRFDLPSLSPVNHFAFADQLVGEIVEHALGHVFVGEIGSDKALAALLSGDAAHALNGGRVKPLSIRRATLVYG